MITYLLYIGSILGALTAIIGFFTLVSKNFRAWIKHIIKKSIKDDEQDIMIKEMHKNIQDLVKENKYNRKANIATIRDRITHLYYKYYTTGELPEFERENIIKQYEAYINLGGNSYITKLYGELMTLKVKI